MSLNGLFTIMFLMTIFTVVYQRQHLLMVLLGLEGVMLMMILILLNQVSNPAYTDSFLFIIILSFGAIEASLGLALLVSIARKSGSDLVSNLTLSKC
uniref:NADH-ubiquinone oxidoreductase chain 4L n=1 Tax=Eclysippe vanelli TaxID=479700 RepID=B3TJZ0_ECLVA|nr:NADH dehydrogenase subunit 4L [Eclysippe vanelli]